MVLRGLLQGQLYLTLHFNISFHLRVYLGLSDIIVDIGDITGNRTRNLLNTVGLFWVQL
jgi:hypothetical protein